MIFDIVTILLLLGMIYLGYRYGTSGELLRLVRIFVILSVASTYGSHVGLAITRMGILRANDWAVLTLTGFLLLFIVLWVLFRLIEHYAVKYQWHKSRINFYFGAFANAIQGVFLLTFLSFMSTQISIVPKSYKPYLMHSSMLYPTMDRSCRKIVTGKFVDALMNDPTGTTTKELILKTISDKDAIKDLVK